MARATITLNGESYPVLKRTPRSILIGYPNEIGSVWIRLEDITDEGEVYHLVRTGYESWFIFTDDDKRVINDCSRLAWVLCSATLPSYCRTSYNQRKNLIRSLDDHHLRILINHIKHLS